MDFRVEQRRDRSRFYATTGLKALGLMEIECSSTRNSLEVVGLLFNVAHYLCDNGLVLRHGDAIGLLATEKNRVRHRRSSWDRAESVWWLEIM